MHSKILIGHAYSGALGCTATSMAAMYPGLSSWWTGPVNTTCLPRPHRAQESPCPGPGPRCSALAITGYDGAFGRGGTVTSTATPGATRSRCHLRNDRRPMRAIHNVAACLSRKCYLGGQVTTAATSMDRPRGQDQQAAAWAIVVRDSSTFQRGPGQQGSSGLKGVIWSSLY